METMLKNDANYRRIKVRTAGLFSSATYWLGSDHLLIVVLDGYRENYRRIYFRDVQAILTRSTNGAVLMTILFLFLLIVLGVLPMTSGDDVGLIFGGTNLVVWLAALIFNGVLGRTGRCQLRTAVQNRDLPSLGRWRQIEHLLAVLVPEINRAQAAAGAESGATNEAGPELSTVEPAVAPAAPSGPPSP